MKITKITSLYSSLHSKPETVINKYFGRFTQEQTHKELKSLGIQGVWFRTKEGSYGSLLVSCLVYNFVQLVRLRLLEVGVNMSFKDALENVSLYLLHRNPPLTVFEFDKLLDEVFGETIAPCSNKMIDSHEGLVCDLEECLFAKA